MLPSPLPQPEVNVTSREVESGNEVDITISRDGKSKVYKGGGEGWSRDGATGKAVSDLLSDPFTVEWIPSRKREES